MTIPTSTTIVLRFRDLVTELGGTIAEHRRIMRRTGHVWWGWWRRQAEHVPKLMLAELFGDEKANVPLVLFDSGTLEFYSARASQVALAPSVVGIHSPQFDATPEYYVRGRYPLWFRLAGDITIIGDKRISIVGRPTKGAEFDRLPDSAATGELIEAEALRDDSATMWLARRFE